jgi:hypothetical protein
VQRGFGGQSETPARRAILKVQHEGDCFMKHSIVNRMRLFTALSGVVLAFAGFAHAGSVDTQRSQKAEKAKKGTLNIAATTTVGELTLQPGEYEVKQVNSASGPVVRFTRYIYDPYAQEGLSAHQRETVGEAKVTMELLASKAKRTKLLGTSNGDKAIGLEIRGNSTDYLF